jgi:hypothetical protein
VKDSQRKKEIERKRQGKEKERERAEVGDMRRKKVREKEEE